MVLETLLPIPPVPGLLAASEPSVIPAFVEGGGTWRLEVRKEPIRSNSGQPYHLYARLVITPEQLERLRGIFLDVEFQGESHNRVTWNGVSPDLPRTVRFSRAIVKEVHIEEVGFTNLDPVKSEDIQILEELAGNIICTAYQPGE